MKLSGKEYAVSEKVGAFLTSYLERVRVYVEKNGIGTEYATDIESRLAEKLDLL